MTPTTAKPSVASGALPSHSQIPLPAAWLPIVEAHLKTEEKVLAWLEIDLNARLRFAKGLVVLTSQRLLARTEDDAEWQSHGLCAGLTLMRRDHAGVGSLELFDADSRLAQWRYTLGQDIADRKSVV